MKGLNDLKEILKDDKLHLALGKIKNLYLADDRAYLKCMVTIFPEERNIIATMSWETVGTNSGDFEFPSIDDMVIVANIEGDDDQAYIIRRLTSRIDTIPEQAISGDKVHSAKTGKKYWNMSDTKILLSRGGAEPAENIVLGQVFKSFMLELLGYLKDQATAISTHTHVGNLGYETAVPTQANDFVELGGNFDSIKDDPIDSEAILSDLAFTEK